MPIGVTSVPKESVPATIGHAGFVGGAHGGLQDGRVLLPARGEDGVGDAAMLVIASMVGVK